MSKDASDKPGPGKRNRPRPVAARPAPRSPREALQPELAPGPPPKVRSRQARHPIVIVLNFFLTLGLLACFIAGVGLYWSRQEYLSPGPSGSDANFVVDQGTNVENVASQLEDRGLISNRWIFVGAAQMLDTATKIKAGEYMIPAHASMDSIMERLVDGRSIQHSITIPEGLTSAQIVARINENPILVGDIDYIPAEGSLLPETYKFTRGASRQDVLERMQRAHQKVVDEAWERRSDDLPIETKDDLITLASIVEKETARADERNRVAAVFINRLNRGMKLQSDPTILYGLYGGEAWEKSRTIYRSDMQRPNAYNTYQIEGLPPGPIANPGRDSIEAVVNPSRTEDIYFVADGTGGHAFAKTLQEHNRNVAKWREIEASRSNSGSSE
ncbi:endolytic transglycosylase MltG [Amorphus coralli]|uniref:endolytic transglycosylase MltG n=1 Tax=Amorphus coralli TaxID=340680 RepID=UPI0003766CD8|nr:endolytic transglycosylase MltG [Amorphus coralli]